MTAKGRVLVVAGSDSGGGAGIQADIKSVQAQGAFASTALTALTAQNTRGVQGIFDVPHGFVAQQMAVVLADIGTDVVKTGMVARTEIIEAVAGVLAEMPAPPPIIVDPVMVASSGDVLLGRKAISALEALLVHRAFLATPNLPEASLLLKRDIETLDDMKRAADKLMNNGTNAVLVKGGHGHERIVQDLLAMQSGMHVFEHERITTQNTHGTGCTLASAIAALLANAIADSETPINDETLRAATTTALDYVHRAIANAPTHIGTGDNRPLNHNV